jgi:hypothetical protein
MKDVNDFNLAHLQNVQTQNTITLSILWNTNTN